MFPTIKVNSTRLLAHIGYWRRLWSSDDFAGQTLADCVEVIHADIVGVWNLPDKDKVRLFFSSWLSNLLKEISTCQAQSLKFGFLILFRRVCLPSVLHQGEHSLQPHGSEPNVQSISYRSQPDPTPGTGPAWLNDRYENK
jgi:hypothetical protein